ncbi:MAG: aspartate ammonia-lyase [Desulfuromonas sp. SDB]|nr:MAG: aspartate ammonia-lyase [Desulfuromonas sp. SDB]
MVREETDQLGTLSIPDHSLWGIHTQRALNNFNISGIPVHPLLIKSYAQVKKACAAVNSELNFLDPAISEAINQACDEIIRGEHADQFPLDALQGGAGTSLNMNLNEVIANRGLQLLGKSKGDYAVIHPLEDVNLHQSTNDTYPTALKIAAIYLLNQLSEEISFLQGAFQEKEKEFGDIVKIGRTELQPAVPLTMGIEFSAFSEAVARDRWRVFKATERIRVINLGGTALGTGLTAPRQYIFLVTERLREITNLGLARGENLAGETANSDPLVEVSGMIKTHGVNLIKIFNDLRNLNLLGEIILPSYQAGSTIMPGKKNPVMCELAIQTGIKIIANDLIITEGVSRGNLQINEFMPLLAHSLLESLQLLVNINPQLATMVRAIQADRNRCLEYFNRHPGIITAFVPEIGYVRAEKLLGEFENSPDNNFRQWLSHKLGEDIVEKTLSPFNLTKLGYRK